MATVIWRFSDGKAGHDNQSKGLVNALSERVPVSSHEIALEPGRRALWWWLGRRYPPGDHLPAPDLLIGAGHRTHLHLLAARRSRGGRCVVLMQPSLPNNWFDLCLVPQHDGAVPGDNLLVTRGVLNTIRPGAGHDSDTGLIVVGGPSRHVRWDDASVIEQIEQLQLQRPKARWWLTTSRRTPKELAERLRRLRGPVFTGFADTSPDWLPARLAEAGEVWVTRDSVSMIYEALSSGVRVGLLDVADAGHSRVAAAIDKLVDAGWVAAPGQWRLAAGPEQPLDEAARCADWMVQRWLNAS